MFVGASKLGRVLANVDLRVGLAHGVRVALRLQVDVFWRIRALAAHPRPVTYPVDGICYMALFKTQTRHFPLSPSKIAKK